MPERITRIALQAFRGIPETFTLDLPGGNSCVVLGDNGTGKSSIADAVEWYFRGGVELLAKEGRADAIRHSGAALGLETKVHIATDGSLGGPMTVDAPSPDEVHEVGDSELFLLRGRTLADFVDKTKGEKWRALAALLGLEAIDQLRLDLQSVRNEFASEAKSAARNLAQEAAALSERVPAISEEGILEAIREKCQAATVPPPDSFSAATDPQWIQASAPQDSEAQRAGALQAVRADLSAAANEQPMALNPIDGWNELVDTEEQDILPLSLYQAADSLLRSSGVATGRCPLCHQPTDLQALATSVTSTLDDLRSAEEALAASRREVEELYETLRGGHQTRTTMVRQARAQGVTLAELPECPRSELSQAVNAVANIDKAPLVQYQRARGAWDAEALHRLEAGTPPPSTTHDQALMELGVLHTLAAAWAEAVGRDSSAQAALALADRVFAQYQKDQRTHFDTIINSISERSAAIYQFLHPGEEVAGIAVEIVGQKGAELSIEFYGRKERPPHRVLSESHLNSLGLALFLAMAETFNDTLEFLVLDDVVNSFDREHRGRLAELLVEKADETQFIVLTHDEQFFTRLSNLAPTWIREQFTSWTYEQGPRTTRYEDDRLLVDAEEAISTGDRIGAAQKGRRAIEEFLQEACEELEALLAFRRGQKNDQRMANEVMDGLRRTLKGRAKSLHKTVEPLLKSLEADLQAGLNVEAHASQNTTSSQEVRDALERIHELRGHFTCGDCGTRIWHRGSAEASQCKCGKSQFPPPAA